MSQERPNWVRARADCTIETAFKMIVQEIQKDLKVFEEEFASRKLDVRCEDLTFILEERSTTSSRPPARVAVRTDSERDHIEVSRDRITIFTVEQEWNDEDLTCDLLICGKVVEPWQVSKKALYGFIFD